MTELELRQHYVDTLRGWIGRNEQDKSYKLIIDTYNSMRKLPRNYAVTYSDAWCAATVSAAAIEAGLTEIIPRECSCARMIALFRDIGRWQERDDYVPLLGDIIFYDWQDSGKGDCAGSPEHVGVVEKVENGKITVIEGNYHNAVGRRNIAVNGRYIRGFGLPDYASLASTGVINVGDTVTFIGIRQYGNSYETAPVSSANPCKAEVTLIREDRAHPYHIRGEGVYGWVDAADILK